MTARSSTLGFRLIITLGCMVLGSLAICAGSIIAINALHQDLSVSVQGYRQLRQLYDVGFVVSKAREAISADPPQPRRAVLAMQSALAMLNQRSDATAVEGPPVRWEDESARSDCQRLITDAIDQLQSGGSGTAPLNLIFSRLSKVAGDVRQSIASAQAAADAKRHLAMTSISLLGAGVIAGTMFVGVYHYRRVMRPIQQIGGAARAFAAGEMDRRIQISGDREFVALAADFNQMARELSALYRDLEAKVETKTRELIRSEQLASVGFLAAGVAHEINNPLGIIAGYGERAIQQLNSGETSDPVAMATRAFAVICDEAFRCKQITDRLLSLAQPGPDDRQVVSITKIAETVIATLGGLGTFKNRSITLTGDDAANSCVVASPGQIKQLLLNLLLNSIEAVDPESGKVHVGIVRRDEMIELSITDNGYGMTAEMLSRIFQPFFSARQGQRRGTGLGLSIAQAIVTDHGGTIHAQSDGPATGSTFTVRLPAAKHSSFVTTG